MPLLTCSSLSRHPDAGSLLSALSPAPFRLPVTSSEPTPQRCSSGCLSRKAQQYRISRRDLPEQNGASRHARGRLGRQYTNQPSEIPSSLPECASRESSPVIPGLCRVAKFTSSVSGRPVPFITKVIFHGPSRPVSGLSRHGRLGAMRQSFHLVTSGLSLLPTLINGFCPPSRKRSSDLECMQEAPTMIQKGGYPNLLAFWMPPNRLLAEKRSRSETRTVTRRALLTGRLCCGLPLARLLPLILRLGERRGLRRGRRRLRSISCRDPNFQSKQKPLHHGSSALQLQPRPLTVAEHNLGATRSYDPFCK